MALPKINHPVKLFKIPSTGEEIRFRPFTVGEEKILLMAKQDDDPSAIYEAVVQVIEQCAVDNDFSPRKMAFFDIEYLFIKLRIMSVGNEVEFQYSRKEKGEEIKTYDATIDFNDVNIKGDVHKKEFEIKATDNVVMYLRYPRILDLSMIDFRDPNTMTDLARKCITKVFDSSTESIENFSDETKEAQEEWLNNLSPSSFGEFKDFFTNLPSVEVTAKYQDESGETKELKVRGLRNFF